MPILKHLNHTKDHFTTIPNLFLQNPDITYEAKGLLCELLSRPDNWIIRKNQLIRGKCGDTKISRIIKELTELGHLYCVSIRTDNNSKIKDRIWIASSVPVEKEVFQDFNGKTDEKGTKTPDFLKPGKPQFKETLVEENRPLYKERLLKRKNNKNKYIDFLDSFKLFPEAFQENKKFRKAWKRWFHYRISTIKSPLTPRSAKTHAEEIVEYFSIEDAIDRLGRCVDSGKWIGVVFKDDKKQKDGTPKKPPTLKKPKKPLSEMTRAEQADAKEAAKEVKLITDYLEYSHVDYDPDAIDAELQRGRDYLEALYKKAGDASKKQKLGPYDIDYARIWMEHLPAMRDVIKAYIDDLVKWVNEPNAGFFKWDHKSFVQFRQKMQRQYYSYDWEKGRPIQS